ncbi:unnamed protein product [Rotaria magnacalcarata]|uniref:Meiosis-specific nuclear structural protein 1 n=1 Tax=Rotaria magnacalcarata TaxID=392030 RepID=A0A8S2MEV2_9BILA|nr:unnamed protein product [Rotaria magnacalcarata]
MAFFHQFNKHQGAAGGGGGGSSSNNNATINWIANQNTQRELEADRVLRERQLAQGRIETEMQQFAGNAVNKRHVREQARVERDRAMEYSIIQAQTEKQQATEIRSQNERLAAELERVKLEKFRDEKMRQQVRETSYELRDLESKLRAAYVQKARTAQMAEKEALKFDSYLEDAEIVRRMRTETDKDEQDRRQREIIRQQEMIRYKQELERQLEERAVGKQKAYEEFLREKLVVDEIVRKIYEEDQRLICVHCTEIMPLMAKFAEDDRIEQMNAQKRRIKQMEHKKAVDNLLEQRRRQMTVDKQREVDERIEGERVEQVRKQIIEEERIKLLREHAHRLLGYLPKGVIRDEKDLDYLGNDFKSEFKRRQVNMQHLGGWGN